MSAHFFNMGDVRGIIHLSNIYKYHGVTFEFHNYLGPMKLKKDMEPSNAPAGRKFYEVVSDWQKLSKSKREKTRIYG